MKTMRIANETFKMLSGKVHWNGKPAVKIYGWKDAKMQGPIVTFNLLRDDGSFTGYSEVAKMASLYGIDLRTGCFCNSGACQMYLEHTNDQLRHYFEGGKECGDTMDLMDGSPTGAVRVSFGRQSTSEDVLALEQMIDYCFLGIQVPIEVVSELKITNYSAVVSRLVIYPVKSCKGITLDKGTLTKTGFQYDRAFMIECCGTPLTQKRHQKLCKIITKLDERNKTLSLSSADDVTSLVQEVPLFNADGTERKNGIVCVNSVRTTECSAAASTWVTSFLGLPDCKLQRIQEDSNRSLSNDAPYLLVNEASISVLAEVVGLSILETIERFRPNIVVTGIPPFLEDTANFVIIDNYRFEVTKKCTRCEMICVNQDTGIKDPQLLVALRNFRQRDRVSI
ncbi:putative Molybdenum cofactor sulfurase, partial [Trichostrongylus colubriformis]